MKPITKKVIQAGLVPKHTILLMQKWGYLEPEASHLPISDITIHDDLRDGFTNFVEELDTLIESRDSISVKETKFSITLKNPFLITWGNTSNYVVIFYDELDQLVFPSSEEVRVGRKFKKILTGDWYEIIECHSVWSGDIAVCFCTEALLVK